LTGADLSVVIVSWNCRNLLTECLGRLRAGQLIVVDNGSTDGTQETLARDWPQVELIANSENAGFSRANNQGIARCTAENILLINADAQITPASLETMLAFLNEHPRAGAVGPRLTYADGSWQRWTAGYMPSLRTSAAHYLFLERAGLPGLYLKNDVKQPFQPEWVSSACMLVRNEALRQVGPLDESLFAYMDDVDVCARMRRAGWEVWYCPGADAMHMMGRSQERWRSSEGALRGFNRYFERTHGSMATAALRAIELAGFSLRIVGYLVAAAVRRREPRFRAMAGAHWAHLKLSLSLEET
jgi:GT2 family glycosyltransferase